VRIFNSRPPVYIGIVKANDEQGAAMNDKEEYKREKVSAAQVGKKI